MIKKIISVVLSVMLLASMFTGVVFAQDASQSVKHYYSLWFKHDGTAATESNNYVTCWNDRTTYSLYDFSDVVPYIYASKSIQATAEYYYRISGMVMTALDDEYELYVDSSLTSTKASSYGMSSGGYTVFNGTDTAEKTSKTYDADKDALIAALESGNNNIVAVRFTAPTGSSNTQSKGVTLKFNYDDETYLEDIANYIDWSNVSDIPYNEITGSINLPSKLAGCDVTWESDSELINVETGVVGNAKADQEVTLTASLSHGGKTATKEFKVVVVGEVPKTATIPFTNYGSARSGEKLSITNSRFIYSGGAYAAVAQLDLAGYEEILKNPGTSLKITLVSELNTANGNLFDYTVYLAPDKADVYKSGVDTYNTIQALGVIDNTRPVLAVDSDGQTTNAANTPVTVDANKENLIKVLDELGSQNSVVTLYITTTRQSAIYMKSGGLTISYFESEVNDAAYSQELEEDFKLENLTTDSATSLTNDLPAFFRGATVEWSSNKDVITTDGKLKRSEDSAVEDTLTANVRYKDYSFTESFDVTIARIAYAYDEKLYEGTKAISVDGGSDNIKFTSSEGVYGKEVSDKIYKITSQSSSAFGDLDVSAASDANDILEFSAYVPADANGLSFNVGIVDGSQYGSQILFAIKNDGLYYNYGSDHSLISRVSPDEWHTYALVAPKGDGKDTSCEMYIDGIYVSSFVAAPTTSGFRHARVFGNGTDINVVNGYMDNIRTYSGTYEPKYDANPDFTSTYDVADRTITLTEETTIADIKASISLGEGVRYVIKDASGNVINEEQTVADEGMKLYVTTVNDTEIDRNYAVYSLRSVVGEYVIDAPVITVDEDTVTAKYVSYNYTDTDEVYTILLAVYDEDETLIELSEPTVVNAVKGYKAENTLTASYEKGCYVKAMVWENMTSIKPILAAVVK